MLGHRLWMNLSRTHETYVTVRGDGSQFPDRSEFPRDYIQPRVDALDFDHMSSVIDSLQPELVINCIGIIKQSPQAEDTFLALQINALLPHRLALHCQSAGTRFIHFSTDCVFSGKKGNYVETDLSDAEDIYGKTKFLGEVAYPNTVTLRTSIIGRELTSRLGLIEWFLAQEESVKGYQKAIYTGFTTDELARIVLYYVFPDETLVGVYHVSSEPISKYDLLMLVKEAFDRKVTILPETQFSCDRSLDSTRFRQLTNYTPPSWPKMIQELAADSSLYDETRGKR